MHGVLFFIQEGGRIYVWWFSPLFVSEFFVLLFLFFDLHVGEIHRVELLYTLVLPSLLVLLVFLVLLIHIVYMSGRFTGSTNYSTLVLPSMNRFFGHPEVYIIQMSGRLHRGYFYQLSFSHCVFNHM